jgi:16S rRNA (guanine527-N7)-methyltransferase
MRQSAPHRLPPNREGLEALMRRCNIALRPEQYDALWTFHSFLRKRNHDGDLTRLHGFETIVLKHYVDCMIVGDFVRLPSPLVDVGSGAGFPGIPLKIRYPSLDIILAEPRPRRVQFLHDAIALLGLEKARVFDHKVTSQSFRLPVRGVVTRALETMDKTVLRTSGALEPGGRLIFLKGPGVEEEIELFRRRFDDRYRIVENIPYRLPLLGHERRIVVVEAPRDAAPLDGPVEDLPGRDA